MLGKFCSSNLFQRISTCELKSLLLTPDFAQETSLLFTVRDGKMELSVSNTSRSISAVTEQQEPSSQREVNVEKVKLRNKIFQSSFIVSPACTQQVLRRGQN